MPKSNLPVARGKDKSKLRHKFTLEQQERTAALSGTPNSQIHHEREAVKAQNSAMRPSSSSLLLLPILASLQQLATAATNDAGCPPATCGNLTLAYPFWLAGGQEDQQPSCGPPAFQLTCHNNGSAFLRTSYMKVLNVDYGSRSLVAVHALLAADAACTVMFNVSSAFAITDRYRISRSNRELYVLSRCRERRPPPGAVPVANCSATSSGMYAYLGGRYGTAQPPANEGSCEISMFPVIASEATTAENYRRLIKGGFLLEWEPVGDCKACTASGGRCRYDSSTAAFVCLCSDGGLRASTCGNLLPACLDMHVFFLSE